MAERGITLVVRARNALSRGLGNAGKALRDFGRSAARIGKAFAKTFLGMTAAVVGFAAKAVHAYAGQEKAERALVASLNAHGDAGRELLPVLKAQAAAIQDETGAADENTLQRMAGLRMLGVQIEQLDRAAKGVIALERAGMAGAAAERAMAGAIAGNYEALTRYVPALRDATDEAEKAQIVNDFLTKGYAAQKEELNTVSGQWAALKGRVGDAWEEIGAAIAQNDGLMNALQRAGDAVKRFGERVAEWVQRGGVQELITGFRYFFEEVRSRFLRLSSIVHMVFASVGDAGETALRYVGNVIGTTLAAVVQQFTGLGRTVAAVFRALRERSRESFRAIGETASREAEKTVEAWIEAGNAIAGSSGMTNRRTMAALEARADLEKEIQERRAALDKRTTDQINGNTEDRVDAEEQAQESILTAAEQAAAGRAALEKRQNELEKQIASERKRRAAEEVAQLKRRMAERQQLAAGTVAAWMAEQKAAKAADREREREAAKAKRLRDAMGRGARLGQRQRDWLNAFEHIEAAQKDIDPGGALAKRLQAAQDQLSEMQEQTKTLAEMLKELGSIHRDLQENLRLA